MRRRRQGLHYSEIRPQNSRWRTSKCFEPYEIGSASDHDLLADHRVPIVDPPLLNKSVSGCPVVKCKRVAISGGYQANFPPSTGMLWPVTNEAASEHSQTTASCHRHHQLRKRNRASSLPGLPSGEPLRGFSGPRRNDGGGRWRVASQI